MNWRVLGLFFLLLCIAAGIEAAFFARRPAVEDRSDDFAKIALRDSQRAAAVAEVKRIVAAAHPSEASADNAELERAREKRLEEMAEAVRRALATPTATPEIQKAP